MTLEKIRDNPESFYNGPLAKSISQDITELIPDEPKKGQVTEEDLRNYQTEIREPHWKVGRCSVLIIIIITASVLTLRELASSSQKALREFTRRLAGYHHHHHHHHHHHYYHAESKGGAVVRALASHQCGLGSNSGVAPYVGWVFVRSLICSENFFSWYYGCPFSSETNIFKFQFDQEWGRRSTTQWMCYVPLNHYFFHLFIVNFQQQHHSFS